MTSQLEQEIADLCATAQRYDARHQRIPDLTWPAGARIAVNFTADFDAMLLRRLLNEPPMQLAKGEFGGRVGIWRLIELFDAHGIKATIFTPGRICELYPQALRAAVRSGHEIADHMWEHHVPKDPGAGARPSAEDRERAGDDRRPPAGGKPQRAHARAAEAGGVSLHLARVGRSPPVLPARRRRRQHDAEPAVPLRDRRRDVLQLRLARQRQRRATHHRPGSGVRSVVGRVLAAVPRRRLSQHRRASVRVRPGAADRHDGPADHPDEDAAGRLVSHLRASRQALSGDISRPRAA